MKAKTFDKKFDEGADITAALDISKAKRVLQDAEGEEAWEREADRREAELDSGTTLPVSGLDAIARLRKILQR